jgi:hypothetical protein
MKFEHFNLQKSFTKLGASRIFSGSLHTLRFTDLGKRANEFDKEMLFPIPPLAYITAGSEERKSYMFIYNNHTVQPLIVGPSR